MDAAEKLALLKTFNEKEEKVIRQEVLPGKHEINFTVSVKGILNVGQDSTMVSAQKARPWLLCAIALGKVNDQTRQLIINEYIEKLKKEEIEEMEERTKKEADLACSKVIQSVTVPRKGSVIASLIVERKKENE